MSLRSAYSTIFQPVLQDGTPFQGQINATIPGNVTIGDSTTDYSLTINGQTITSTSGSLNVSGNIVATGTLSVSAATISNVLNVSGITTVSALTVQNYLNVSGATSLNGTNINGNLNVSGSEIVSSNLEVKRSLSAESVYSVTLSGVSTINGAPYIAGGNPFNWSTLPAISDVNMAGYSISGLSNLTVSNNVSISGSTVINSDLSAGSVYSSTLSGVTLINGAPYIPGVNPSNWSTYPAVTNLSMGGFNLGNVNAVSISGRVVIDGSATITGLARFSNVNISGLLNVSGGNVQNKWNVSGQLNAESASIVGTFGVSGNTVLSNAYVTSFYGGATTLSSLNVQTTLGVSGAALFGSSVNISDVLNVSGLTTLSGLTVSNTLSAKYIYSTTLSGVVTINGNEYNAAGIPSNWAIYGAVQDVNLSGNDIYNVDNLNVSGISVFAGGVSIPAIATISHANVVGTVSSSNVTISNMLNVSGLTTLSGLIVQNLISGNFASINTLSASNMFVSNTLTVSDLVVTNNRIHIGQSAGFTNQGLNSVAIGVQAGLSGQRSDCIAIGRSTGNVSQGTSAIAIGAFAGNISQGFDSIALGATAGCNIQGNSSIAIGSGAGCNIQGNNSIAIGNLAGLNNQISNSIILNATGSVLNAQNISGFYVAPVSQSSNLSGLQLMTYNPATSQIQQNSNVTISGGNVGINCNAPALPLEISGHYKATTNNEVFPVMSTSGLYTYLQSVGNDYVRLGAFGPTGTKPLVLQPIGCNVGIGTTTPSNTLEVSGTIQATRLFQQSVTYSFTKPTDQSKWFKIATFANNFDGLFLISWSGSGEHGDILLSASSHFNNNPNISILRSSWYPDGYNPAILQIRLALDTTTLSTPGFIEVYTDSDFFDSFSFNVTLLNNSTYNGSTTQLYTSKTAGSTGLVYYTLDVQRPFAINNKGNTFVINSQGAVGINCNAPINTLDVSGGIRTADWNNGGIVNFGRNGNVDANRRAYVYHDGTNLHVINQETGYISIASANNNTGSGRSAVVCGTAGQVDVYSNLWVQGSITSGSPVAGPAYTTVRASGFLLDANANVNQSTVYGCTAYWDGGTLFYVNFTSNMPDDNYIVIATPTSGESTIVTSANRTTSNFVLRCWLGENQEFRTVVNFVVYR